MKLISRVVALLPLALALPSLAAGPIIVETPLAPFTIPANVGCTFAVNAAPEVGKPNGGETIMFGNSQIAAGPGFLTLTNANTGKSINLNVSGPARTIFTSNGTTFVGQGPTLAIAFPVPPAPPELQGVVLANGRLVAQFDNSGTLTSAAFTGTTTNVCSLLE